MNDPSGALPHGLKLYVGSKLAIRITRICSFQFCCHPRIESQLGDRGEFHESSKDV